MGTVRLEFSIDVVLGRSDRCISEGHAAQPIVVEVRLVTDCHTILA